MCLPFQEFFLTAKHILRSTPSTGVQAFQKWGQAEVDLNNGLRSTTAEVHKAMCDNIDTRYLIHEV